MKNKVFGLLTIGMTAAVLISAAPAEVASCAAATQANRPEGSMPQMAPDMQKFYDSLSSDNKRKFDSMDPQSRQKAMDMAKHESKDANKAVEAMHDAKHKNNK